MAELLKISELALRSGVQKATVAYYVREGLLPPPVRKPHRNMAYYSSDFVERIKLIKELQAKRFMPLSVIKQLFVDKKGVAEIRAFLTSQAVLPASRAKSSTGRASKMKEAGLSDDEMTTLERIGLVGRARNGKLGATDAAIVQAVGLLKEAGLGRDIGFQADDLEMYRKAMEDLIRKEITIFAKRVVGTQKRTDVISMARGGLEGTNALLVALRRKIFLELLQANTAPETPPGSARSPRRTKPK
jgi:DNA-binding transcriptional MerR regulator